MGSSTSPAEFSRKIVNMATITERRQREVVTQGALTTKAIIVAEAASKGVSPTSKIAGAPWSVVIDVKGSQNPSALVAIRGPFHLVENDTDPHKIYRKVERVRGRGAGRLNRAQKLAEVFGGTGAYRGGGTGSGRVALQIGDDFRRVVNHPGTRGKKIFAASKLKARKAVPVVMSQRIVGGWREALR